MIVCPSHRCRVSKTKPSGGGEGISVDREQIFGPVLCIKRVADFEEGLRIMNANPFVNESVIYIESGAEARQSGDTADRRAPPAEPLL